MLAKPLTHIYESLNTLFDPYICAYFSIWYHSLKYVNLVLIVVFFFQFGLVVKSLLTSFVR